MVSCNTYFCYVFRSIIDNKKYPTIDSALIAWRYNVQSFGFARKLGIDLPSEQSGVLPSPRTYDRIYGKNQWKSLGIISLSIGQGEVGATTLQLANLCTIIANRGYYYIPHIIKSIGKNGMVDKKYYEKQYCSVDPSLFDHVVQGMYQAVHGGVGGTAVGVRIPDIEMCGKTGTAQNPHGANNSVFICFAPKDNPKIAVAVYVENAGYGATYAAPVAALMVEKYLKGKVTRTDLEQKMLQINLVN
jgi:penicillin-binding protein 2